jgi:hypothetical protein
MTPLQLITHYRLLIEKGQPKNELPFHVYYRRFIYSALNKGSAPIVPIKLSR